tara:strand:- start:1036 stop:1461 length:426 start_codon:yes stop_codon:yes gene_type:complete
MLARYRHNLKYNLMGGDKISVAAVEQPLSVSSSLKNMEADKAKAADMEIAQNKLSGGAKITLPNMTSASDGQNKQMGEAAKLLAQGQADASTGGGRRRKKRTKKKRRKARRKSKRKSRRKSRRKYKKRKKSKRKYRKKRLY